MKKTPLLLSFCILFLIGCGMTTTNQTSTTPTPTISTTPAAEETPPLPSPVESSMPDALVTPSTPTPNMENTPPPIAGYTEAESGAIRSELRERIVYRKTNFPVTEVWLDGTDINTGRYLGTLYLTKDSQFHSLDIENNIQALTMDNQEWLAVTVKANVLADNEVYVYEDSILEIMIPISRNTNGDIAFGEYYAKSKNAFDAAPDTAYPEPDYVCKQLHMTQADLTHDGIDDYIETCLYLPPETDMTTDIEELIERQLWVAWATVQVYDGSTATLDNMGQPIWFGEYSAVHAGNGQVSIVNKDGRSYLLMSSLWQGQGFTDYFYKVIALDSQGHEYIIDKYAIDFSENDNTIEEQKQLVASFREIMEPWLTESQLIIATDVSLDEQFITTDRKQFTPQEYYDIVWQQWN